MKKWKPFLSLLLAACFGLLLAWGAVSLSDHLHWKALVDSFNPNAVMSDQTETGVPGDSWKAVVESFNPNAAVSG